MRKYIIFLILICISGISCSEKAYITAFSDVKFSRTYKPAITFRIDGVYMPEPELLDSTLQQTQKRIFGSDGSYSEIFTKIFKKSQRVNFAHLVEAEDIPYGGGIYRVSNDTLYVTTYNKYYWSYNIVKHKFIIENDETLTWFEVEFPDLNQRNHLKKSVNVKYIFIPADSTPTSDIHYLKKHKWIWDNKADWQQYMKKYKTQRNQVGQEGSRGRFY